MPTFLSNLSGAGVALKFSSLSTSLSIAYPARLSSLAKPFGWFGFNNNLTDDGSTSHTATGVGTFSYDSNTKKTGTHSLRLSNTSGAAVSAYVRVPGFALQSSNFTLMMWLRPNSNTGANQIATPLAVTTSASIGTGQDAADIQIYGSGFGISPNPGLIGYIGYTTNGGFTAASSGAVQVSPNTWYHFAITNTGAAGTGYLNGSLHGTPITNASGGLYTNVTDLIIGIGCNNTNRPFDGFVDDVRVYKRALSATEIQTIYNETNL